MKLVDTPIKKPWCENCRRYHFLKDGWRYANIFETQLMNHFYVMGWLKVDAVKDCPKCR